MRLLGCGDRWWTDQQLVDDTLDGIHAVTPITMLIEGEARGADKACRSWAERRGVPFTPYPADWGRYGRAAGPIRNQQQLDEGKPDRVVAFHDNLRESKGTAHMVRIARDAGLPVTIITHEPCHCGNHI